MKFIYTLVLCLCKYRN